MPAGPDPINQAQALNRRAQYVIDEARADHVFMEQLRQSERDDAQGIKPEPLRSIRARERAEHA